MGIITLIKNILSWVQINQRLSTMMVLNILDN